MASPCSAVEDTGTGLPMKMPQRVPSASIYRMPIPQDTERTVLAIVDEIAKLYGRLV